MHEVLQRLFVKRGQLHHDPGGEKPRIERKVLAPEARLTGNTGRDVPHRHQVAHFIDGDIDDRPPPALYGFGLLGAQAFRFAVLQREGGVEVGAHQIVLELRRLLERVDQLFVGRRQYGSVH